MKPIWMAAGVVCLLALSGCGSGTKTEGPQQAEVPSGPVVTPDVAHGGTITGKVSLDGPKPAVKMIDLSASPACVRAHGASSMPSEEVVVNSNGTLKNAFVWIKAGLPAQNWQVPSTPVELNQTGCMYSPHVLGVMTRQQIAIKNSDPTNHNIHPAAKVNAEWNESQPPGSAMRMQSFAHPEVMIPIQCNVHPWMRAYIGVVPHPFFAVTGGDGTFTIKGLPPGTYTVETWHEKYGTQDQQVTVGAGESKAVDFSFKG